MSKIIITYELDPIEDQYQINSLINANKAQTALWDVDQEIRNVLKYGEEEWLASDGACNFLERLREIICESGVLNDY